MEPDRTCAAADGCEKPDTVIEGDYARIGEVAAAFGITLRALRFYEDKELIQPKRLGTLRLYDRRERARLGLVLFGRKVGFSLRDVKQMMDLYDPSGGNRRQLRVFLDKARRQLGRLESERATLEVAIGDLSAMMAEAERRLREAGGGAHD